MRKHIEPCPFCGMAHINTRRVSRDYVDIEPHSVDGALSVCMDGNGYYWVRCCNCNTSGPHYGGAGRAKLTRGPVNHTRDHDATAKAICAAIDAWNLREPPQLRMEMDDVAIGV